MRSRFRWYERIAKIIGYRPYRCSQCNWRFWAIETDDTPPRRTE